MGKADLAKSQLDKWARRYFTLSKREQNIVKEGWRTARILHFGTPLEKLKSYAERANPAAYIFDIHGLRLTPPQEAALEMVEAHSRVIICSGTNIGKSTLAAHYLSYRLFAVSQLPDPDSGSDKPGGGIVLLPGPSHDVIADTIWREFLLSLDSAAERGFPLGTMFKTRPRLARADWKLGPKWFTRSISPERRADNQTAHTVSGRHSWNETALIEEGGALMESVWRPLDEGLSGEHNKIVVFMNPDPGEPTGPAWERIQSGKYQTLRLSCLDFPNVVKRKTVIPGGAVSVNAVEASIRSDCHDLGPPRTGQKLDKRRHQFLWALPALGEAERGPREDGGPGMEGCEEHVFAPNAGFIAGKLGQHPTGFGDCPLDMDAWDECVEFWPGDLEDEDVDRWGVDPADAGPNDAVAAPVSGPTVEELWAAVWNRPGEIPAMLERGHIKRIHIGRLRELEGADGWAAAKYALGLIGRDTPVICDVGAGGKTCHDAMLNAHGMNITSADFGLEPLPLMEGEKATFRRRDQLIAQFAQLVAWRLICIPPDSDLRRAAQAQRINWEHDSLKVVQGEYVKVDKPIKMFPKRKIAAAAGGGLDKFDAVCVGVQSPDGGGFSMSTVYG